MSRFGRGCQATTHFDRELLIRYLNLRRALPQGPVSRLIAVLMLIHKPKRINGVTPQAVARMEKELARLQEGITQIQDVNLFSKVTPFAAQYGPPAGRKDSWRGAAAGPARRTNHPDSFYADHPWLPFHRCPMRRSFYNQRWSQI